jgi:hypothetical protein
MDALQAGGLHFFQPELQHPGGHPFLQGQKSCDIKLLGMIRRPDLGQGLAGETIQQFQVTHQQIGQPGGNRFAARAEDTPGQGQ